MNTFKAFRTEETADGFTNSIQEVNMSTLEVGEVIIRVVYSGINYKDLLSASGNKGVTKNYPHTPGIDAAGYVVSDKTGRFAEGDQVVVMGYDMGMNIDGGFAEYISVPAAWVLPKPEKFSLRETMQIGTSGFTAALGIMKMIQSSGELNGPIVVSGATGGVGMWAVQMLTKLGFEAWGISGKKDALQLLAPLESDDHKGADGESRIKVLSREEAGAPKEKAIARPRWAAGIDTVGGETLAALLKQTSKNGSIATCGNVTGAELPITVLPFILNGINLLGINAADTLMEDRIKVWELLEKVADPDLVQGVEISMEGIEKALIQMKEGSHTGRFLIKI